MTNCLNFMEGNRGVAQWYSTCSTCAKSWVKSPAFLAEKTNKIQGKEMSNKNIDSSI